MFRYRGSSRKKLMLMYGSVSNRYMRMARKRYAGNIVRSANRNRRFIK